MNNVKKNFTDIARPSPASSATRLCCSLKESLSQLTQATVPFCISSDIDECSADTSPCDENADCTNSNGSYRCSCKQGFTGNGSSCNGTANYFEIFST